MGKTAAETISAMLAVFGRINPHLRRSITFNNDTAFAQHGLLRTMRHMTTWFCDAYASWQKGGLSSDANATPRRLDVPEAITFGDDAADAPPRAVDALEAALAGLGT